MLNKKLIPLAFGQGLDTKKDKKQQVFGMLRKAENVVFETLDSARKRNGYDRVLLHTAEGANISTAEHLSKFKDELLLFDSSKLYGFSESLQTMQPKGTIYSVFPTSWPVLNNAYSSVELDMLVLEGLKFFAYRNSTTNEVRYSVQDQTTQTMIASDLLVATSARTPKFANIGNIVFLLYGSGNDILYKRINVTAPRTLSGAFTLTNNYETTGANMQAVSVGSKVICAYNSTNPAQRLTLISVGLNNTPSTPVAFASQDASSALDMFVGSNNRLVISYASATVAKYLVYAANLLGSILAPTTLETIADVSKITGYESTNGQFTFYYGISAAATYNHRIRSVSASLLGVVGTPASFLRSVDLASKCFVVQGAQYMLVSYASELQPTYYVVDSTGTVVSRVSQGVAGGHLLRGTLPAAYNVSDDIVIVPSLYKTKFVADNGKFYSLVGITNTEIDFVVEDRYQNAALNNNLIIGGGVVQTYDGETVAEQGFNVFPEAPTLLEVAVGTPTNNPSLDISAGDYGYCIVYRWTDNQGQEHRSAPSEIVSIVTTGANKGVQVTIPTCRLTEKSGIVAEVYRTEDAGTVFYLINDVSVPFLNSTSADTVVFLDGRNDAAILMGRTLYTTGGILENTAAPSARVLATHTASKRIFLAGLEDPNMLQYSKQAGPGQPVEFNDALQIPIDPVGGPITTLASMDEKIVIFEQDAIFVILGSGPNNAGQQDTFTQPDRVASDIGCLDPKSMVLTPDGLMFKSRKGIYLLNRALQLSYIGAPVEEFNGLTISSAKVVGELNQVRFTTIDGDCLVYNYVYKFWATFTNHKAKSAETIGNNYYYLRTNNELYKENRLSFSDAGVPIKMRLGIGWISFAGLQGFSRVYRMLVLGDWLSRHNLLIKVGYDFNEAWIQSTTITPDTADIDAVAYGDDSPYGAVVGEPYGGYGNPYQFQVNMKRQKCQSIKLEIEDVQENAGEGFSLSQITFQLGGKSGLFKVANKKTFATS